jgi:hypothetical protein
MLTALNAAVLGVQILFWLLLFSQPHRYVQAMFIFAPWLGVYVVWGAEWDFFKVGLVLSPLLWFRGASLSVLGWIRAPLTALGLTAIVLLLWQLVTKEVHQFDILQTVDVDSRLVIATALFLLRLSLPVLISAYAARPGFPERCINAYVNSVLVLCVYGLAQQTAFLLAGTPLTYVMRQGIFAESSEYSVVNIFAAPLLRVHSFGKEPKDLALFCLPAIGWLWSQLGSRPGAVPRLVIILSASILTFSSSFVLVLPLVIIAIELLRKHSLRQRISTYLFAAFVISAFIPVYLGVTQIRVQERFSRAEDLLQVGRERPLYHFLGDHFPRSLAGYGVGTQTSYLASYMSREYWSKSLERREVVGVDSFLLTVLSDLGVQGIVLVTIILWVTARDPAVPLPARAALAAVAIGGIPLNCDLRSAVLWLFLGTALAEARAARRGPLSTGRAWTAVLGRRRAGAVLT